MDRYFKLAAVTWTSAVVFGLTALSCAERAEAGMATVYSSSTGEVLETICNADGMWYDEEKGFLMVGVDNNRDGVRDERVRLTPYFHVSYDEGNECTREANYEN